MGATARIDLGALRWNLDAVRDATAVGTQVIACVKANAYGHGLVGCAWTLADAGVGALGIARLDEAVALRDAGISCRLVMLAPELLGNTGDLVRLGVEILVDSEERLRFVVDAGADLGTQPSVHLAVDTGMGRFGAKPHQARDLAQAIVAARDVQWAGVMTHFPVADSDLDYTRGQWERFDRLTAGWREDGIPVPPRHAANSAAIFRLPESHADIVRPGLALYGMQSAPEFPVELRPVMSLSTEVAALHDHAAGDSIGYGRTFVASAPTRVATLPIGYGDGLPRAAGGSGWVLIRGRRAPIVGRISMDQTTVNVTSVDGVEVGDSVVLIGAQGGGCITAEEWAAWTGTISYEVTTRLLPRVRRMFVDGDVTPRSG